MTAGEISAILTDDSQTVFWGAKIAAALKKGGTVYLHGELGAGKTTLCRGILRAYGHQGAVKSPTYTIIEPYELDGVNVYHFDLYRMVDAEEWEYLGVDEYFSPENICLVEWPEKGANYLPASDINITLLYDENGRKISISASNHRGVEILQELIKAE